MHFIVQGLADLLAQHVHEILRRCLFDARDATEALDEQTLAATADSRQIIQLTLQGPFRAAAAMRRHCKAMRLITNGLQQLERWITAFETNGLLTIRNIKFFFTFCETGDGDAFD